MQNLILVPKTCHVYHLKGATESGIYKIDPDGAGHLPLIEAYCELQNSKCIFLSCRKIRIVFKKSFRYTYQLFSSISSM